MRTVNTPPRRKSVINVFSTPPLRRSLLSLPGNRMTLPTGDSLAPSPFRNEPTPYPVLAADSDDENDDDENMLTATGDISMSYPYYVPGALGALSPPQSRRGTPSLRAGLANLAQLQRPRPPVRRLASTGAGSYKFRTLTIKGGSTTSTPSRASSTAYNVDRNPGPLVYPDDDSTSTVSSCNSSIGSIGSIEDEDPTLSTPQSRFAAFMKSRDLTRSPKKQVAPSATERRLNERLGALAQQASVAIPREVARPGGRPLRGNAPLPPRLPIPDWGAMEQDN